MVRVTLCTVPEHGMPLLLEVGAPLGKDVDESMQKAQSNLAETISLSFAANT